jgi:hypothetical protein
MAASEKPQRISIGFHGGQVLSARVGADALDNLQEALRAGAGGWHELRGEDGTATLNLGQVAYVLVGHDEPRVGFGL